MSKFIILSASVACAALLGLGFAYCQSPEEDFEPRSSRAIRAQEAQLNAKIAALKQRQLEVQKKLGFYVRVEMKGRLELQVIRAQRDPRDSQRLDTIIWAVNAGEHRYELSFDSSPTKQAFIELAEKSVGQVVLVSGELAPPRHPQTQILEVKTFSVPK